MTDDKAETFIGVCRLCGAEMVVELRSPWYECAECQLRRFQRVCDEMAKAAERIGTEP